MPETGTTVEAVLSKIRAEVARRRGDARVAANPDRAPATIALEPHFRHIQLLLDQAQAVADVGTKVPPFGVFGPVRRWLARAVTRVLYYFLKVISVDQRVFNGLILDALRTGSLGLHKGELDLNVRLDHSLRAQAESEARIAHLDAAAGEHDQRLVALAAKTATHESALADSQIALRQLAAQLAALQRDTARAFRLRPPEEDHRLDELYVAFEDRFRGARDEIKDRLRVYLPTVREAEAGTAERPILDLGCGRGEWLEVLKEEGLHGRGIDLNHVMVHDTRARGLDVTECDALACLRSLPPRSVGAVTAFQVIEHISFEVLVEIFDATVCALQPGGVAIFEVPNPQNLLVGACTFYVDPTHIRPLPPDALRFLAEASGLTRVEIRPLHPLTESQLPDSDSPVTRTLNHYFFGPQDFAVIGYRA